MADRGAKKYVYLPYRGTISFWCYLVPLRLVSIFLNVGRVEISCGLLPTHFSTILLSNCFTVKRRYFKSNFRKNNSHRKKLNIRHSNYEKMLKSCKKPWY